MKNGKWKKEKPIFVNRDPRTSPCSFSKKKKKKEKKRKEKEKIEKEKKVVDGKPMGIN